MIPSVLFESDDSNRCNVRGSESPHQRRASDRPSAAGRAREPILAGRVDLLFPSDRITAYKWTHPVYGPHHRTTVLTREPPTLRRPRKKCILLPHETGVQKTKISRACHSTYLAVWLELGRSWLMRESEIGGAFHLSHSSLAPAQI